MALADHIGSVSRAAAADRRFRRMVRPGYKESKRSGDGLRSPGTVEILKSRHLAQAPARGELQVRDWTAGWVLLSRQRGALAARSRPTRRGVIALHPTAAP
jgi:hypothetical protein